MLQHLKEELSSLQSELSSHKLYTSLSSVEDVKVFMGQHVFAVWDFMSLLKALQIQLTSTNLPWMPMSNPNTARFVNEIVLGEETDINQNGEVMSHFEMYLDAMEQAGADMTSIQRFLSFQKQGFLVRESLDMVKLNQHTRNFVSYTFDLLEEGKAHKIAASFTFGREDLIPDMFFQIIESSKYAQEKLSKFKFYLERHIELDGDEHGPLALQMIQSLCGEDQTKWNEAIAAAKESLQHRINLWTGIHEEIQSVVPRTMSFI